MTEENVKLANKLLEGIKARVEDKENLIKFMATYNTSRYDNNEPDVEKREFKNLQSLNVEIHVANFDTRSEHELKCVNPTSTYMFRSEQYNKKIESLVIQFIEDLDTIYCDELSRLELMLKCL